MSMREKIEAILGEFTCARDDSQKGCDAILNALAEPTQGMIIAGGGQDGWHGQITGVVAERAYKAMIEEAKRGG